MRRYTSKRRDVAFELDGVTFTPAHISILDLSELAKFADMDTADAAGIAKVGEFFEKILGADYQRFRDHCAASRTDMDTLMEIVSDVLGDMLGVPTPRPSDSSAGPPTTGRTLKVISSDGTVREEPLTPQREEEIRAAVELATG